jgi:hypothetical protein
VFIAGRDELEEQVGRVLIERDESEFVNDEQLVAAQLGQLLGQAAAVVGFGQPRYTPGGSVEQNPAPGACGPDPDPDRQVRFPGARLAPVDPPERGGLVHVRGVGEDLVPGPTSLVAGQQPAGGVHGDLVQVRFRVLDPIAPRTPE